MLELLRILSDGEFHSGAEIGRTLGLTRAAVWKRMQNLQARTGHGVESLPGKGYRLEREIDLLDASRLQELAGSECNLLLLDSIDSTNEHAKRLVREGSIVQLVVAEEQTSGKGRRGRAWQSPYGSNLYLSLIWPVTEGMRQLEGLSLAVGLAVLRTIEAAGVADAGLKWPNDVLVGKQKIAGILLELMGDLTDRSYVVIGIGINVNMYKPVEVIDQPWTSIGQQMGGIACRHGLFEKLYANLQDVLDVQLGSGFGSLRKEWEARHLWQNKKVCLSSAASSVCGVVTGINERGELGIQSTEGLHYFAGGELSLRLADDS